MEIPVSNEDEEMAAERRDDEVDAQTDEHDDYEEFVDESRPAQRLEQKALWVDGQIRRAMARGDFDNLPGAGKPIEGIGGPHDPDWWVKKLIEREQLSGLGPPAIMLRKEDAELDERLDKVHAESEVRRIVDDFNSRVVNARMQLRGGPPVVTRTRDVDSEVEAWRERRAARFRESRAARAQPGVRSATEAERESAQPRRRRWWRRGR
jgi:hypothetical protein